MIIPLGYIMENGKFSVEANNAEIVRRIYADYISGTSLKVIAGQLVAGNVEYAPGKMEWNKNRIHRILTDKRYLGTEQYPGIVELEIFEAAQRTMAERNTQKDCKRQEIFSSSVVPIFCGRCGHLTKRRYDNRRKNTTRHYCQNPECPAVYAIPDERLWEMVLCALSEGETEAVKPLADLRPDIMRLNNEIEREMRSSDIDGEALQRKIYECAALQYQSVATATMESMDATKVIPYSPFFIQEVKRRVSAVELTDDDHIRLKLTAGKE